jgi:hypothetical protein
MELTELGYSNPKPRECGERSSGKLRGNPMPPVAISLLAALALSFSPACSTGSFAQAKVATEYEVKAAFLYNFAKFVEWPPSTFPDPKQPFSICVFGRDPFGHVLEDALLGKTIGDRPVLLEHAKQIADLAGCHIVFVSAADSSHLPEMLAHLRGRGVLIVGESEGFAGAGGTIQFVLDQNRVRFAINPDAAERAGLKISSKLLALAVIMHDAARNAEAKD